eukprot:992469-Rhodomonas_salina.1
MALFSQVAAPFSSSANISSFEYPSTGYSKTGVPLGTWVPGQVHVYGGGFALCDDIYEQYYYY